MTLREKNKLCLQVSFRTTLTLRKEVLLVFQGAVKIVAKDLVWMHWYVSPGNVRIASRSFSYSIFHSIIQKLKSFTQGSLLFIRSQTRNWAACNGFKISLSDVGTVFTDFRIPWAGCPMKRGTRLHVCCASRVSLLPQLQQSVSNNRNSSCIHKCNTRNKGQFAKSTGCIEWKGWRNLEGKFIPRTGLRWQE